MEPFINIKYKQVSVDKNYEEFLKFHKVGVILRKTALAMSPVCVLTREGDVYTLTMITSLKTIKIVFKLDEEFDSERLGGIKVKSTFTVEGNKLIQVQTEPNGGKTKHVREYTADKMILTTTAEGWNGVSTRIFEKID